MSETAAEPSVHAASVPRHGRAIGEGGRLFAAVSGLAALIVLMTTFAPWIRLDYHVPRRIDPPTRTPIEVYPWLDSVALGIVVTGGAVLVIAAVSVLLRSATRPWVRILLALSVVAVGISLAVFSVAVGRHPTWIVPDELGERVPFCSVETTRPCWLVDPSEAFEVMFLSGGSIAVFGFFAAIRYRSSRASRWSDARILVGMLATIAGLLIGVFVALLFFVSRVGH
jgi:hypothetical protein